MCDLQPGGGAGGGGGSGSGDGDGGGGGGGGGDGGDGGGGGRGRKRAQEITGWRLSTRSRSTSKTKACSVRCAYMGHGMGCLNDVPRAGLDWQVACGRLLTALVPHSLSPQLKDAGSALGAGDGRGDPADYRRPASAGHGHVSPEIDEQGGRLAPLSYPYEGDPL